MKANQFAQDKQAQVGIGTMIVFIATVLVAAVAAGVLISVGGDLQSQSKATGSEASGQVANALSVVRVYGVDVVPSLTATAISELDDGQAADGPAGTGTPDDDYVDTIEVFVTLAPGTDRLDLADLEILLDTTWERDATTQVDTISGVTTYFYTDDPDATAGKTDGASYFSVEIQDPNAAAGDSQLTGSTLAKITLLGTFTGGATNTYTDRINIPTNTEIGMTVVVPNGSSLFLELTTPRVMDEDYEQLY